uniref:Uncharacterized protein n=1 Tax=uncultured marine virus TaxID=186617 RepID=A0A0F7L6X0_9VIRU|nr:hypothetical protein [uncultured marine virus]
MGNHINCPLTLRHRDIEDFADRCRAFLQLVEVFVLGGQVFIPVMRLSLSAVGGEVTAKHHLDIGALRDVTTARTNSQSISHRHGSNLVKLDHRFFGQIALGLRLIVRRIIFDASSSRSLNPWLQLQVFCDVHRAIIVRLNYDQVLLCLGLFILMRREIFFPSKYLNCMTKSLEFSLLGIHSLKLMQPKSIDVRDNAIELFVEEITNDIQTRSLHIKQGNAYLDPAALRHNPSHAVRTLKNELCGIGLKAAGKFL